MCLRRVDTIRWHSMLCGLSLSRKHIATEGGNLKGFQNALLVDPIRSDEADIKLVDLMEKHFPVTKDTGF